MRTLLSELGNIPEMPFSENITPTSNVAEEEGLGFVHGFIASLSMIVVSEIGDKTFFIAAIMSMKHSRLTVFAGAISALALMTILSVVFGWAATIIPKAYTYYISTALFAIFGLKMLREGCKMSPNEGQEELEEVQSDLRKRDEEFEEAEKRIVAEKVSDNPSPDLDNKVKNYFGSAASCASGCMNRFTETVLGERTTSIYNLIHFEKEVLSSDVENGTSTKKQSNVFFVVSRIILQAFTLTFLAEWGDRSQLATIILAARENVYGVTLGGILGHSLCTGLAVIGGRFIAQRISVRTVMIIGGVVFLIFAFSALIVDPTWGS